MRAISAGFGYGITRHSFFCSFWRNAHRGVRRMVATRGLIQRLVPQCRQRRECGSLSDIAPVETPVPTVQIHFSRTGFQHVVSIFFERIEAKSMAKSARNGAGRVSTNPHRVIVYLLSLNQIRRPCLQSGSGYSCPISPFMVRVLLVFLPVKREHDIIGVQLARGFEILLDCHFTLT